MRVLAVRLGLTGSLLVSLLLTALFLLRPPDPRAMLSYVHSENGVARLQLYDPDWRKALALPRVEQIASPTWSPDGRWLTYLQLGSPGLATYTVYDAQTGVTTPVEESPFLTPTLWSPDSRRFLVVNSLSEMRSVDVGSAGIGPLRFIARGHADALWSPDSRRLYYRQSIDDALVVIDMACLDNAPDERYLCQPQPVPAVRPIIQLLGWLPDNSSAGQNMMVLAMWDDRPQPAVFGFDPDTGSMTLMLEHLLPGTVPVWSPDGRLLAAALVVPIRPGSPPGEAIPGLYLIDAETGDRALLWTGVTGQLGWSPTGDRLTFELVTRAGNDRSVWIYDRRTSALANRTPPGTSEVSPSWIIYRGRAFDPLPLLVFELALVAALAMDQVVHARRSTRLLAS